MVMRFVRTLNTKSRRDPIAATLAFSVAVPAGGRNVRQVFRIRLDIIKFLHINEVGYGKTGRGVSEFKGNIKIAVNCEKYVLMGGGALRNSTQDTGCQVIRHTYI